LLNRLTIDKNWSHVQKHPDIPQSIFSGVT
jgi:hypothetical protein